MTTATTPTPRPPPTSFDPDDDDRLIGRVLSRREVLALMGAASVSRSWRRPARRVRRREWLPGAAQRAASSACDGDGPRQRHVAAAVASALPSCVVVPELTEGPYYVNENLDRSDIRIDTADGSVSEGAVLTSTGSSPRSTATRASRSRACWSTSGIATRSATIPTSASEQGHDFLRGYQQTDASRQGHDHDDLPGLVPGPRGPYPLQDPDRCRGGERPRVHLAAVLRRRVERPGLRQRRLRLEGHAPTSSTRPTASTSRARG